MALRRLRHKGDSILHKVSKPVELIDGKIQQLVDDLLETMYGEAGVGLAAVQVGVLRRVLVLDVSEERDQPIVIINPVVVSHEGEQTGKEACLSVKGFTGLVSRPMVTVVRGLDRHGEEFELRAEEFMAVALNHELDHLDGILYTEKASELYNAEGEEE